jgi:glutamyl-Q tRNA(Asp) synthetase
LHIGSLTTAVASYLHARQREGGWLVRIEDIDPPREAPGAADQILQTLEAFGLQWDGAVLYQSTRLDVYENRAQMLLDSGAAFRCSCTRATLRAAGGGDGIPYPGTCRAARNHARATALRMRVDTAEQCFVDGLQGTVRTSLTATLGDYVIFRKDRLPAYHLAVVIDDVEQAVTTVVRGVDLLDSTAAHLHLQQILGLPVPQYFHIPVIVNAQGQKLSKQTRAPPVTAAPSSSVAAIVLGHLGLDVPADLRGAPPAALWDWALSSWRIELLEGKKEVTEAVAAAKLVGAPKID